ncbi:MAG: heavy metal translocating P-type ATPase [Clostridia bacterium]|nr:heavy metal translocating P-type ATPase [Clostridia bacterium]
MTQYNVTGMSCAACAARIEKAVSKVNGVTSCTVSLLTNSMGVEGSASESDVIKAVVDAGYGAKVKGQESAKRSAEEDALEDHETPVLRRRLIASIGFLAVLMYVSMGHMMWGWPLPAFFNDNHVAMGIVQMLLAIIVMIINKKFFVSGFKSLLHGAPNMDTLVAMGSSAAFVYSTFALLMMTRAQVDMDTEKVMGYMHEFYFESAAMILTLITVGKMLEARAKGKTTSALKGLMSLAPKTATIVRNGEEVTVPVEEVRKGDIFAVRPGESIPVDGIILEGSSAINESSLTGESIPVDKTKGDMVSAATINTSGYIRCEATRVGEDTTLSQIIQMVSDAAATKAPIAKVADKVSGIFVPVVIGIATVTLIVWLLLGQTFGYAIARAISVLVISCPCALGLATPVAIMVGNGKGAKNGILFKTAVSLEETGKVQIIALDKTGTITSGEPKVTDIMPASGFSEEELMDLAYALEAKSEHPLARAIVEKAMQTGREAREISGFAALPGNGLKGQLDGKMLYGGSKRYITGIVKADSEIISEADRLAEEGKTPILFAKENRFAGLIAVADVIKPDSAEAIKELKNMGIRVVMLTGDNERTAKAIGKSAGVDEVVAGVLPEGKESIIRELQKHGKVAMVGDGINDAPALTRADMGIAIGAGTDVAIDAADIVLMKSSLKDVAAAVRLSRATLTNIHENLFWAFIYNSIGIPLAAGALISFGITLNPMFGAAAMSLSSFCVVSNALRLNFFRMYDPSRDRKHRNAIETDILEVNEGQEDRKLTKIMHIEGMMCEHCEATVRKALEAVSEVVAAEVSHVKGTAEITLDGPVDDAVLIKAVEDKDYKVISVEDPSGADKKVEEKNMKHTVVIEGMMCMHCEATVKKALENIEGIESAEVSHEKGTAVITTTCDVDPEVIKKAVEDKDYKFVSMD